jgi:hypothetical protein
MKKSKELVLPVSFKELSKEEMMLIVGGIQVNNEGKQEYIK